MHIRESYNEWAAQYDTNENRTRDLEAMALRTELSDVSCTHILEMGCGTGKNTEWLQGRASKLTGVDLSEEMLKKAKQKITSANVNLLCADMTQPWTFAVTEYDLVTFSLVLEHISDLEDIFAKAAKVLTPGGRVYVGELHPFKQYSGSKARFASHEGTKVVTCFNHHLSDFYHAATNNSLMLEKFNEYFDNNEKTTLPRIMTMVFKKLPS